MSKNHPTWVERIRLSNFTPWYAWYPVYAFAFPLSGAGLTRSRWVWLQKVEYLEHRSVWTPNSGKTYYVYRLLQEPFFDAYDP